MTMTSFESAFPSTKTLPLEACSVFATSATLQEEKTCEPAENKTQGQNEREQLIHVKEWASTQTQTAQTHKQKVQLHLSTD